ncbi:MAG: hypothetical protein ACYC63_02265 [Armatimonadota bacterium]
MATSRTVEGQFVLRGELDTMDASADARLSWWRPSRLDLAGAAVGALTGLIAAAPLLWLAAEAHRTGDLTMSPAADFRPLELLAMWAVGSLLGGWLAALLTRAFMRLQPLPRPRWGQYVLHLCGGASIIIIVAPALPAALLALVATQSHFLEFYLIAGGLVGWQSGVITLVFLYTFRMLERIHRNKELYT